jgi:hypothetical protein
MTRPGKHGPLEDAIAYLKEMDASAYVKDIGENIGWPATKVAMSLANYLKRNPLGEIARVKIGVYRYVSPAEQARRAGRARKAAIRRANLDALTVGEAALNGVLTANGGHPLDNASESNVFDLGVKRGGIQFPSAVVPGLKLDDAVVAHYAPSIGDETQDMYFVWRGKMWKAYQI